jgi:hypothetical protein
MPTMHLFSHVFSLEEFYKTFNGTKWIDNSLWLDGSVNYCSWYGVVCDEYNVSTTRLELNNNGLIGKLDVRIIELMSGLGNLVALQLNGNNIMV